MHVTVSTALSVRIAHIVKTLDVANRAKTLFQQLTHTTVTNAHTAPIVLTAWAARIARIALAARD